jgi:hypothetical protein
VVLFEGLLPECCGLVASGSAFLSDLYKNSFSKTKHWQKRREEQSLI